MLDHLKETLHTLKHKNDYQLQAPVSGTGSQSLALHASKHPDSNKQPNPQLLAITQKCIDVYLASSQPNGEIGGIGYWQTANGYTAIALHEHYSGSTANTQLLVRRLETVASHHADLINEFNDDTLWWGNCVLDVYQIDRRAELVGAAAKLQRHVSKSVVPRGAYRVGDMDMEGAVMWTTRGGEEQVNSITTALYAEVCGRLAGLAQESPQRREWLMEAENSLTWVLRCRYREHEALVLDTIKLKSKECVDWSFTYTTGQAISACVALFDALSMPHTQTKQRDGNEYRSSKSPQQYLELACDMAKKSMCRSGWVEQNGVLTEHGAYGKGNHEAWKNDDAVGFKSVLVRGLAKLYRVLAMDNRKENTELKEEIGSFIETQFAALQQRNTNGNGQYGPWWNGPMEMPTSHSQMAVLDVMAAIHLVRG
ncbi:glycoside hydrolase [Delphinella strobiligena]|nr:glycoside hydrolase [Delphinella strobiligena]